MCSLLAHVFTGSPIKTTIGLDVNTWAGRERYGSPVNTWAGREKDSMIPGLTKQSPFPANREGEPSPYESGEMRTVSAVT
jgi:hypothetical protein